VKTPGEAGNEVDDPSGPDRELHPDRASFPRDMEFEQWAVNTLGLSHEKVQSLDSSSSFQSRVWHWALCRSVTRVDWSKAPFDAKRAKPGSDFLKSARKLFGLQDLLNVRKQRQMQWGKYRTVPLDAKKHKTCVGTFVIGDDYDVYDTEEWEALILGETQEVEKKQKSSASTTK